jgi:hypothetical protein
MKEDSPSRTQAWTPSWMVVSVAPVVEQDETDAVIWTVAAWSTATSDWRSSKVVTVAPLSVLLQPAARC